MAVTVTQLGSLADLKTALAQLVPAFFASVEYDDDDTPTTIICKDADDHTLFTVANQGNSGAAYTFYKDAETAVTAGSNTAYSKYKYFYNVGSNGAIIQTASGQNFVVIAKTNLGGVGFVANNAGMTSSLRPNTAKVACWGDDVGMTADLTITDNSDGMTANHCQFVPIPMHGTYTDAIYLPKAFYMPIAQPSMRRVAQEVTGESGVYMTNGYVALLDD